jgi:hypothetical protein
MAEMREEVKVAAAFVIVGKLIRTVNTQLQMATATAQDVMMLKLQGAVPQA